MQGHHAAFLSGISEHSGRNVSDPAEASEDRGVGEREHAPDC